jgi:hypothetical protein
MPERNEEIALMRERLDAVARRPGMYGLRDEHRCVIAFVSGCVVSREELFTALTPWAVSRVGGARAKYGWAGALAALSAARVAEGQFRQEHSPLAGAFISSICDYFEDLLVRGEDAIRAEHAATKAAYDAQHAAAHRASHVEVQDSEGWDRVCRAAELAAVPMLVHCPHPGRPWAGFPTTD